ncbi:MAG: hypothetical protein LBI43_05150 [Streptococcaceae bacterium]|jgi:hypothetical protein|nr:hypothetical protein [Streptococcaceae bacterium]
MAITKNTQTVTRKLTSVRSEEVEEITYEINGNDLNDFKEEQNIARDHFKKQIIEALEANNGLDVNFVEEYNELSEIYNHKVLNKHFIYSTMVDLIQGYRDRAVEV